jgi:lipopolysaccharide transport system ATP-binding protein
MSAILRLTTDTLVIDKGKLLLRAKTSEAVDFYLSRGLTQEGQRFWQPEEFNPRSELHPKSIRIIDKKGNTLDTVRSTDPFFVEFEYSISKTVKGLRVGIYLITSHGEFVFTSFDTDDQMKFEKFAVRDKGSYISRVKIPANVLNGGRYVLGVNASSYRIKTYFHDEQAMAFNVDSSGAPGTQWPETRLGPIRPSLEWKIEKNKDAK